MLQILLVPQTHPNFCRSFFWMLTRSHWGTQLNCLGLHSSRNMETYSGPTSGDLTHLRYSPIFLFLSMVWPRQHTIWWLSYSIHMKPHKLDCIDYTGPESFRPFKRFCWYCLPVQVMLALLNNPVRVRWWQAPKEEVYSWLGLQAPWKTRQWSCGESGQLLIDKYSVIFSPSIPWYRSTSPCQPQSLGQRKIIVPNLRLQINPLLGLHFCMSRQRCPLTFCPSLCQDYHIQNEQFTALVPSTACRKPWSTATSKVSCCYKELRQLNNFCHWWGSLMWLQTFIADEVISSQEQACWCDWVALVPELPCWASISAHAWW